MAFEETVAHVLAGRRVRADGKPVFVASGPPVSAPDIARAENHLGSRLPAGYRWFVTHAGPGEWCGEQVPAPDDLYPFDQDVGVGMEGMIAVVWNADGTGDYLAFKPAEAALHDDPPLYLCSHDPFGCNRAADSFGAWAVGLLGAADAGEYFYSAAYGLMDAELAKVRAERRAARRWWQFWR